LIQLFKRRRKHMKVRSCFASQIWEMGGSLFFQRLLIALLIAVLTFGSLPVQRTFAAPSDTSDSALNTLLESAWSRKLRKVRAFRSFYNRVRVYPADFKDPDELARAHDLLNRYGTALRGARGSSPTRPRSTYAGGSLIRSKHTRRFET
jgi:hypothetical protein